MNQQLRLSRTSILLNKDEINVVFDGLSPTGTIDIPTKPEHLEKLALEIMRAVRETNKAQLKAVAEWGDEECPHTIASYLRFKRECLECWQALLKEVE